MQQSSSGTISHIRTVVHDSKYRNTQLFARYLVSILNRVALGRLAQESTRSCATVGGKVVPQHRVAQTCLALHQTFEHDLHDEI